MYEQVEKLKENKSRAVGNSIIQNKNSVKQAFEFVDNRETLQLKRLSQIVRPVQLMGCAASTSAGTTRHKSRANNPPSEEMQKASRDAANWRAVESKVKFKHTGLHSPTMPNRHSKHLSRKHSELIKKIDRANCEIQSLRRRHAKAPPHLFQ